MQTNSSAFAPFIDGPGLHIGLLPGAVLLNTTPTQVGNTTVTLTANATNRVYLNPVSGAISVTTSAFPLNSYPIATVTTSGDSVLTLTDNRCDVAGVGVAGVQTASIALNAAQVIGSFVTPVPLLAAPALPGQAYVVLGVAQEFVFGSAAFTDGTGLAQINIQTGADVWAFQTAAGFCAGVTASQFGYVATAVFGPLPTSTGPANLSVDFALNHALTGGTGSQIITTLYYTTVSIT